MHQPGKFTRHDTLRGYIDFLAVRDASTREPYGKYAASKLNGIQYARTRLSTLFPCVSFGGVIRNNESTQKSNIKVKSLEVNRIHS